jgi:hypothetical protein
MTEWCRLSDRVLRRGRWQIARYQDVPQRAYELWDMTGVDHRAGRYGTLIAVDTDHRRLQALAEEREP